MYRFFTFFILSFTVVFSLQSLQASVFTNTREGSSRFIQSESIKEQLDLFMQEDRSVSYEELLTVKNQQCASKLISDLQKRFSESDITLHILSMRKLNMIDDVVTDVLLKAAKRKYYWSLPPQKKNISMKVLSPVISTFLHNNQKGICLENNYLSFQQQAKTDIAGLNEKEIIYIAYKKNLLTKSQFHLLESLRRAKIEQWPITLKGYYQLRKAVVAQSDTASQSSEFVTIKVSKSDYSRRELLYRRYNYYQMMMLGDLVQKMKKRLEASEISIVINYSENHSDDEVISLGPMEQFRFVLKLLRKEYSELAQSSIFENTYIDYDMIMTAAYELGYVTGEELQELSDLDDIWNPKVSKKDKVLRWLRSFGGVASLVMPTPYGFVPLLAIMVIESVTYTPKPSMDNDYELF